MSITDELRKYAQRYKNSHDAWSGIGDDLDQIADHIDKEYEECKGFCEKGFCERIEEAAKQRKDVTLFGVDYTPLHIDADGQPVHIGDVMEWPDGETFEVIGIGEGGTLFYIIEDCVAEWTQANDKRHHHTQTVEELLSEMLDAVDDDRYGQDRIIAEYAKKLRELLKEES